MQLFCTKEKRQEKLHCMNVWVHVAQENIIKWITSCNVRQRHSGVSCRQSMAIFDSSFSLRFFVLHPKSRQTRKKAKHKIIIIFFFLWVYFGILFCFLLEVISTGNNGTRKKHSWKGNLQLFLLLLLRFFALRGSLSRFYSDDVNRKQKKILIDSCFARKSLFHWMKLYENYDRIREPFIQ